MADIELVVKLDEAEYINIKNAINSLIENGVERASMSEVCLAILDSTPLPKGHGKIVDIDKLIDSKCNECGHIRGVSCDIPCYAVRRMLDADTIIEADKESEE